MYRLEQPLWLWGIAICVIVFLFFAIKRQQQIRHLQSIFSKQYWKDYLPNFRLNRHWLAHTFLFVGIISICVALANPQKRGTPKWALKDGKEVVFALDLSNSMLAEDVAPSRLIQAKEFIKRFIGENKTDRLGLVVFAGNAYIQVPITSDPSSMMMHLQSVHPDKMPLQGTRIAEALSKSEQIFSEEALQNKVLVLVSDGEDHESEAVSLARDMHRKGITLYTIGVGSAEGAKIIDPNTGVNKLDADGQEIISRMNTAMLEELASVGGGEFYYLQQIGATINNLKSDLKQLSGDEYQAWMPGTATSYAFPLMILSIISFVAFFAVILWNRQRYSYA